MGKDMIDSNEIRPFLNKFPALEGISDTEDLFDKGLNSLAVLELQVQMEDHFGTKVKVTDLLANPTLNGWCGVFSKGTQGQESERV